MPFTFEVLVGDSSKRRQTWSNLAVICKNSDSHWSKQRGKKVKMVTTIAEIWYIHTKCIERFGYFEC